MATSLTLRAVKGTELTEAEVDGNFTALRDTADSVIPTGSVPGGTLLDSDQVVIRRGSIPYITTLSNLKIFLGLGPSTPPGVLVLSPGRLVFASGALVF